MVDGTIVGSDRAQRRPGQNRQEADAQGRLRGEALERPTPAAASAPKEPTAADLRTGTSIEGSLKNKELTKVIGSHPRNNIGKPWIEEVKDKADFGQAEKENHVARVIKIHHTHDANGNRVQGEGPVTRVAFDDKGNTVLYSTPDGNSALSARNTSGKYGTWYDKIQDGPQKGKWAKAEFQGRYFNTSSGRQFTQDGSRHFVETPLDRPELRFAAQRTAGAQNLRGGENIAARGIAGINSTPLEKLITNNPGKVVREDDKYITPDDRRLGVTDSIIVHGSLKVGLNAAGEAVKLDYLDPAELAFGKRVPTRDQHYFNSFKKEDGVWKRQARGSLDDWRPLAFQQNGFSASTGELTSHDRENHATVYRLDGSHYERTLASNLQAGRDAVNNQPRTDRPAGQNLPGQNRNRSEEMATEKIIPLPGKRLLQEGFQILKPKVAANGKIDWKPEVSYTPDATGKNFKPDKANFEQLSNVAFERNGNVHYENKHGKFIVTAEGMRLPASDTDYKFDERGQITDMLPSQDALDRGAIRYTGIKRDAAGEITEFNAECPLYTNSEQYRKEHGDRIHHTKIDGKWSAAAVIDGVEKPLTAQQLQLPADWFINREGQMAFQITLRDQVIPVQRGDGTTEPRRVPGPTVEVVRGDDGKPEYRQYQHLADGSEAVILLDKDGNNTATRIYAEGEKPITWEHKGGGKWAKYIQGANGAWDRANPAQERYSFKIDHGAESWLDAGKNVYKMVVNKEGIKTEHIEFTDGTFCDRDTQGRPLTSGIGDKVFLKYAYSGNETEVSKAGISGVPVKLEGQCYVKEDGRVEHYETVREGNSDINYKLAENRDGTTSVYSPDGLLKQVRLPGGGVRNFEYDNPANPELPRTVVETYKVPSGPCIGNEIKRTYTRLDNANDSDKSHPYGKLPRYRIIETSKAPGAAEEEPLYSGSDPGLLAFRADQKTGNIQGFHVRDIEKFLANEGSSGSAAGERHSMLGSAPHETAAEGILDGGESASEKWGDYSGSTQRAPVVPEFVISQARELDSGRKVEPHHVSYQSMLDSYRKIADVFYGDIPRATIANPRNQKALDDKHQWQYDLAYGLYARAFNKKAPSVVNNPANFDPYSNLRRSERALVLMTATSVLRKRLHDLGRAIPD